MELTEPEEPEEVTAVLDVHDCDPQIAKQLVDRTAMEAPQTGDPETLVTQFVTGPGVILPSLYTEHPSGVLYGGLD
jgi:hypothetical protein